MLCNLFAINFVNSHDYVVTDCRNPNLESTSNSESDITNGYSDIIIFKDNLYAEGFNERIDFISEYGEIVTVHNSGKAKLRCAVTSDEILVAAGDDGTILYSYDGKSFSYSESDTDNNINGIVYTNGMFVAGSENGVILVSENGKSWFKMHTGAKGDILSLSSNKSFIIGVTDAGEIIKSFDGTTWEIMDYNKEYDGYHSFSNFSKILATENRIVIIGTHDDGSPSILFSTLGNVWTQRLPIYYDDEGILRSLSSKPNDVICDPNVDQFIIVCNNGELLSMPSCSKCNKYLKISDTNLNAIISDGNNLVIVGDSFSMFKQPSQNLW